MEFIKSTRGARLLVKVQYHFLKNKTGNGKTYWACTERRSGSGCRVKIILDDNDNLIQQTGEHEHIPNPEKTAVKKIRASMERDAQVSNATTNNIIAANIAGAPEGVLAKVGKIQTVRRAVRRQRAAVMGYPEIPEGILFDIPEPFNRSSTGEPFIQFDNGREDRIVIFGTRESLNFLQNSNNWFMDGTFSTAPPQFLQLYTIHGLGRNIVGAYCLLTNKRRETYIELLHQIQQLTNEVVPQSIMIDYEQAMIGALDVVYPIVPQKGCLFHLSQSIYRKIQERGLSQRYVNDVDFRTNLRMIAALSFFPIEDTLRAFEALADHCGQEEQVILDYFESTYIGELRRGR